LSLPPKLGIGSTASGARREFVRILRPVGWLVLLWNERGTDSTPFLRDYEQLLLTYGADYKEVRDERTTSVIRVFRSNAPDPNDSNHAATLRELKRIFDKHQQFDRVLFEYTTRIYFGQVT
jgi:hypothetical protein